MLFLAAVLFLVRTAGDVGFRTLAERLSAASLPLLGLLLLLTLVRYAAWGTRWQILALPVSRVGWWSAQKGLLYSLFLTTVLPASRPFGGILRGQYAARASRLPSGPLIGAAIVDQFGYSTVSMILGAAYVPAAFWGGGRGSGSSSLAFAAGAALLAPILYAMWRRRAFLLERLRRRIPTMAEAVAGAVGAARTLLARRATWAVMAAGGAAVWAANVLTYQLAGWALGSPLPFSDAAIAFCLGSLAGTLTGTPGGAGTTEAAALAPLLALGIPADHALALILLARGVHYAASLVLGGLCCLAPHPAPPKLGAPADVHL
jgi:uncharacterized membrane protein YbhN (UPF0104 family)